MTRGFSLIELILVLAVLGVALAFALPQVRGSYRNFQVSAFLSEMDKNIRYAQYRSVMEGKRYVLKYDPSAHTYRFLREKRERSRVNWVPAEGSFGRVKKIPGFISLWFRDKQKIFFLPNGEITEGRIEVRGHSETLATVRLENSLRGVEIERKGYPSRAA